MYSSKSIHLHTCIVQLCCTSQCWSMVASAALAGMLLKNLLRVVPELTAFANLELKVWS